MTKGIDCDVDTTAEVGCILAEGFTFIGRYINRMTPMEAQHISNMGAYIVSIYETRPTSYSYFTEAQGEHDAKAAMSFAKILRMPQHEPIYFPVDYDASQAEIDGNIQLYFSTIDQIFSNSSMENFTYLTGGYGSGALLTQLLRTNTIKYAYLAEARGWLGTSIFTAWNLKQVVGASVCGINVDHVISNGNGGGWKVA